MSQSLLPGLAMVLLGALLEGVAQVSLTRASRGTDWRHARWLVLAIALFAVEISLYTRALQQLPVAIAYPLSALSYAAVVLAAWLLLGERPNRRRWLGVLLIGLGAGLALP